MSKSFVAARLEQIDADLGQVVPVRFFEGHVHRLLLLAAVETAVIVLCVYCAALIRFPDAAEALSALDMGVGWSWIRPLLIAAVVLLSLASMGLYQLRQRIRFTGVLARLCIAGLMAGGVLGFIFYFWPPVWIGRGVLALAGVFSLAGLALTRFVFLRVVDEDLFKRRVLVWGAGERAATIAARLRRRCDQRGFKIVGYIRAPGDTVRVPENHIMHADGELFRLGVRHRVEEIVVAMDDRRCGFPAADLLECRRRGIAACDVVTFLERESGRISVDLLTPSWLIFSSGFHCDLVRVAGKRAFDVALGLAALVIASPFALLTAIAIFLEDRGPVLYRQQRVGQNGRVFPMLKFRSMKVNAEVDGQAVWAMKNDPRVTRVGAFIRRSRIDELPQILNVLAGHMSFVGPRPERPAFVEALARTIPYYPERHLVKPGITGWAQVRHGYGASERDARDKLEYDLYYVKNHSLALDLMVLLQTVEIVLLRIGSR